MLRLAAKKVTERSSTGSVLMMCLRWHRLFMMQQAVSHVKLSLGSSYARVITLRSFEKRQSRHRGIYERAGVCEVPGMAGRGPELEGMWAAWSGGDRKAALAAISDDVVDALIVHGTPDQCREQIGRYLDNGVTTARLRYCLSTKNLISVRQCER